MSRPLLIAGVLLATTVLAMPVEAQRRAARASAGAAVNWSRHVERTPEGGYRLGNPAARVKLVEYGSIGCPHCASFSAEAMTPLRDTYIRTGRVSYEYRPLVLFDSDPGIYKRLLCQAPATAFDTLDRLYASQAEWRGRVEAHEAELEAMPMDARFQAAFDYAAVNALMPIRGGAGTCAPAPADLQRLSALQDAARAAGINGTPTFLINGIQQPGVGYWNRAGNAAQSLEPKLQAALAAR